MDEEKPKLKSNTETIHWVQYEDLENLAQKVYGREFNFIQDQECGNDSDHSFEVDGTVDDYEEEEIENFVNEGKHYFLSRVILNDLRRKGHIEEDGTYVVQVSW